MQGLKIVTSILLLVVSDKFFFNVLLKIAMIEKCLYMYILPIYKLIRKYQLFNWHISYQRHIISSNKLLYKKFPLINNQTILY